VNNSGWELYITKCLQLHGGFFKVTNITIKLEKVWQATFCLLSGKD